MEQAFFVPVGTGVEFNGHSFLRITFGLIEALAIILAQARGDRGADGQFNLGFGDDQAGVEIGCEDVGGL